MAAAARRRALQWAMGAGPSSLSISKSLPNFLLGCEAHEAPSTWVATVFHPLEIPWNQRTSFTVVPRAKVRYST